MTGVTAALAHATKGRAHIEHSRGTADDAVPVRCGRGRPGRPCGRGARKSVQAIGGQLARPDVGCDIPALAPEAMDDGRKSRDGASAAIVVINPIERVAGRDHALAPEHTLDVGPLCLAMVPRDHSRTLR